MSKLGRLTGLAGMVVATTVATASARDLRAVKEPEPTGCEQFGPGFRKVDGSMSCIKIDGRIRVESGYRSGGSSLFPVASSWLH